MNGDNPVQPTPSNNDSNWQYVPSATQPPLDSSSPHATAPNASHMAQPVTWTASEFVAHQKSPGWYVLFILAAAVLTVLVYLITRDTMSVIVIVMLAILFGVSAARKPRVLAYAVDANGLTIGHKFYSYNEFKSFSVVQEGAFTSIEFSPLKRFMLPISIYYEPKDEARIFEVISRYLPLEQRSNDPIDRLARRIRF